MMKVKTFRQLKHFILFGLVLMPIPHYGEVLVTRTEGLFSKAAIGIKVNNPTPCEQIQVDSSENVFHFSYNNISSDERCRPARSCPTLQSLNLDRIRQFEIRDGNILLGIATEVYPNSKIFVTARHVIQALGYEHKLDKLLSHINFENSRVVEIFGVDNPNGQFSYDIIFFSFSDSTLSTLQFQQKLFELIPSRGERASRFPFWISVQGARFKEVSKVQVSCGQVHEKVHRDNFIKEDFLLQSDSENRSAPASSGSLVFQYEPNQRRSAPVPLGIISCQQQLTPLDKKLYSQQIKRNEVRTRVVSFERIFSQFVIQKIDRKAVVGESKPTEHFDGCWRIDGRGAGSL